MTPFDPIALLVMLQTFYPIVGPGALQRARVERPEYFAGAEIIGTSGDKIRLPDARIFDLIFDVLGPDSHWQALDVTGPGGSADAGDPLALEPGPLTPIDESAWPSPSPLPEFAPLVAGHLGELAGADGVVSRAADTVMNGPSSAWVESTLAGPTDDAAGATSNQEQALDALVPDDVVGQTFGQHAQVPGYESAYSEPPPPDDAIEIPPAP